MSLTEMVDGGAAIQEISAFLDDLEHDARWAQLSTLSRATQRRLFERAAAGPPLALEHFVPPDRAPLTQVTHHGRNTLPLPAKHKLFRKPFCRPADREGQLYGFNDSPSRWLVGPGFFVAVLTAGNADWEARGSVVIDYFRVPDSAVCAGWPEVIPNHKGVQFFVYHQTRDFMRRVSAHVSIGAAYKKENALDHYFVLCRED
ncbi:MAG: hypothetical protein H6739_27030 [Alphaproteobacteria bacterium]|nr:hypothetical protein [Alphaproteobacteria bacterium]